MKKENSLQGLFAPKSIAIVGASNKKGKVGTVITENILKLGYSGRVFLVNPSYKFLKLNKCYPSLQSIKGHVDVAIISVPAKFVVEVIEKSADKIKNFVVISAGFAETGAEGAQREADLKKLAKKHELNILGPNCLGFISPQIRLNASFAGGMPNAGNIAFVSQSGALAVALMDIASEQNLAFSHVISVGNKMQLDESGLLEYLAKDEKTKVIGMYLEGIKDGKRFIEVAKKVSKIKPIVILKAGKTEKSQIAISSHTGALAGADNVVDVAFQKAGIIRANDLTEFFNLLTLISFDDAPKNEKVAVITNAGGAGVLVTDSFKDKKIVLAEFSKTIKNQLLEFLPSEGSVENPVDLLGDATDERYQKTLDLLAKKNIGTIISVLTPQQQTPVEKIADVIIKNRCEGNSSIATVFIGGQHTKKSVTKLRQHLIANFENPNSAIEALDKYYKWSLFKKSKNSKHESIINVKRKKDVEKIITEAKKQKRSALYFSEAALVMAKYGIKSVESFEILPNEKIPAILKFPVALKVDSDKVLHKSDRQALILNIKDFESLEIAVKKLRADFPEERFIVQIMHEKQLEIILGIKKDPIFGPVIVFGLGGIYAEIFKMVDFIIPPVSSEEIRKQILESKIGFLFSGARGQKPYDIAEFATIIEGLAAFCQEIDEVKEFDINPLFIYNNTQKALAVDIKIIL